jgi:hypothetical protein
MRPEAASGAKCFCCTSVARATFEGSASEEEIERGMEDGEEGLR